MVDILNDDPNRCGDCGNLSNKLSPSKRCHICIIKYGEIRRQKQSKIFLFFRDYDNNETVRILEYLKHQEKIFSFHTPTR